MLIKNRPPWREQGDEGLLRHQPEAHSPKADKGLCCQNDALSPAMPTWAPVEEARGASLAKRTGFHASEVRPEPTCLEAEGWAG